MFMQETGLPYGDTKTTILIGECAECVGDRDRSKTMFLFLRESVTPVTALHLQV